MTLILEVLAAIVVAGIFTCVAVLLSLRKYPDSRKKTLAWLGSGVFMVAAALILGIIAVL